MTVAVPPPPRVVAPYADLHVGWHRLALLRDGAQAFPAMLSAIASARETVCLETYILRDDRTGERFADALIDRARAGVEVNLMYDAWGSSVSDRYVRRLRAGGVRVLAFRPIELGSLRGRFAARLFRRNHRKSLVVDRTIGFLGGINISDDYAGPEEGGKNWRDTHVRIEGPAALELEYFFLRRWRREKGPPLDEARYGSRGRRPDPAVQVISNDLRKGRQGIERAYRQAIQRAKRRVRITNAYFLPTLRLLGALVGAARRGVDVRVIVAGTTDVPAVLLASRSIYGPLLSAGVRIFEYRGRVLHAKTATVDGVFSTVGSSNLDTQSLRQNLEVNAFVRDERFAAALESMFDEDLASSVEITPDVWERRGLLERAASWGAYLFKELL